MGYTLNHQYFDQIDTEAKAYFLGLLFADGCVQGISKNSWRMFLGLQHKDHHIVNELKEALEYTGPLYVIPSRSILSIASRKLGEALIRHGCVPRKSLVLKWPDIPSHLQWHFVRGYFDGDGSLAISGRGSRDVRWMLISTEHFVNGVKTFLAQSDIHATIVTAGRQKMLSVSGNRQIKRLLDLLYKDANVYLRRKHKKKCEFEKVLTTIRPIKQHSAPLDKDAIVKAYINGMPILEIEKRFDVTNAMVYRYLKKQQVALRQNKEVSNQSD